MTPSHISEGGGKGACRAITEGDGGQAPPPHSPLLGSRVGRAGLGCLRTESSDRALGRGDALHWIALIEQSSSRVVAVYVSMHDS